MYLKNDYFWVEINSALLLIIKCIRNTLAIFYEMKNTDEHEQF